MKKVTFFILLFILQGCIPKATHKLNSYDLYISNSNIQSIKTNKVIKIKYPTAIGSIGGSRIYYKRDNTTNYYLYSRWSNSLISMIYKDILTNLRGRYKSVVGYDSSAKADILLETQIIDFYHILNRNNSYVKITINVRFIDSKSKKIVKEKLFSYKKEIATANAKNFVLSAKKTLREFIGDLKNIN